MCRIQQFRCTASGNPFRDWWPQDNGTHHEPALHAPREPPFISAIIRINIAAVEPLNIWNCYSFLQSIVKCSFPYKYAERLIYLLIFDVRKKLMLAKLVFFVCAPWVFFVFVAGTCIRQGHVWFHKSWDHWIRILLSVFMLKEDVVKKYKTNSGFEVRWKTIKKKLTVGLKLVRQDTCAPDGQKNPNNLAALANCISKRKNIETLIITTVNRV